MNYQEFLASKQQMGAGFGFDPLWMPDFLYPFQQALVDWAQRIGRGACFADCGLGKTPMQLVWAENVVRKTNGRVLILTPLAVAQQTAREAEKFGIEAHVSRDGSLPGKIVITNYEQLGKFNQSDFVGVVCDESSILKNYSGATRYAITQFMCHHGYRLLTTATAAPNDYTELGTSSEALGGLTNSEMLKMFFKANDGNSSVQGCRTGVKRWQGVETYGGKFRLRGHAKIDFWRWVCSWSRAMRKPSDLGFNDDGFILPELTVEQTVIRANKTREGMLIDLPAIGLREQREERRRTIQERCEMAASKVADTGRTAVCWCHLNDEGDLLERLIPGAVQVAGKDSDEKKEEALQAFADGQVRVLVTKPTIAGFGLNWQHCNHQTFFPSHSFEQWYQAVRRSWRFGQERPVHIDVIASEGEKDVLRNLQRKQDAATKMFENLVELMNEALHIETKPYGEKEEEIPTWL